VRTATSGEKEKKKEKPHGKKGKPKKRVEEGKKGKKAEEKEKKTKRHLKSALWADEHIVPPWIYRRSVTAVIR
jgi:hypothetical protein